MLVGHQYIGNLFSIYIDSFHMPLFFLVSGMFFRKNKPFFQNLESSIRGLLIPYLFFSVINLSICWISPYVHPELYYNMTGIDIFRAAFTGIFIGVDQVTSTSFLPLGPLWFLMALFVIRVFCSATSSVIKNEIIWAVASIAISISIYFILTTNLYSLKSGMMATPFFIAGFLMCKVDFTQIKYKYLIIPFLILYFIFIIPLNGPSNSDGANFGNWMVVYYINAIVGTLIVLLISTYITHKNNYLQKIGCNTLVILGLHAFFLKAMQIISVYFLGYDSMYSVIYIIVVPIIAIICCLYMNRYIIKYFPIALGKR